ncbi:MAG: LDH2 family malate/lactate/ureidoglycolate dehydrogenase [Candidatus Latescibacterota bacterium]|jgi:LDH2 family malate/lactate/ureidoglycolate dehydrogenase
MNDTTYIGATELISACGAILEHEGVPAAEAAFVAETLVEADLRGIHSHGILRLGRYVRELRSGVTNPNPHIHIAEEGAAIARIDGDGGLGPLVGRFAMQACIDKAKDAGSATVTAFRSRHFGTAGYYALMARDADLVGISMTVASPRIAPTGGTQPLFGNNPLSLSVPGDQEFPLLIDFASGRTGAGRLELAATKGESIPSGLVRDLEGNDTTDPEVGLRGSIIPIAEHKGYGLTLFIEILAGLLGGAPYFGIARDQVEDHMHEKGIGHFFMAIDPSRFMPLSDFKAAVASMVTGIKSSPRMPGTEEILVPGELEFRRRNAGLERGIPLATAAIEKLNELARACGREIRGK